MNNDQELAKLKARLETELKEVEAELAKVGRPNPAQLGDWEVTPAPEGEAEFREEIADHLETMEERTETELVFEARRHEIAAALERLTAGTYGRCLVCQQAIEPERLQANPAAATCKTHAI